MACKVFKSGFSLVEVMMFLLIASLIVAASVPIVTKKHYKLPQVVGHGAYLCYYNQKEDGSLQLHESRWAGKYVLKQVLDRDVTECKFVVPEKAPFFQISAIGGGGGGGDAGYNGGAYTEGISPEQRISPFELTEDILKDHGITKDEFYLYRGFLRGYAKSGNSGAGGDIGYVKATKESKCREKEIQQIEQCTHRASGDSVSCYCNDEDGNKTNLLCSNTTTETIPEHTVTELKMVKECKKTVPTCEIWNYDCEEEKKTRKECRTTYHTEYFYDYVTINGITGKTTVPSFGDQTSSTRITRGPYPENVPDPEQTCVDVETGEVEKTNCVPTTCKVPGEDKVFDCSEYKEVPKTIPESTVTVDNMEDVCSSLCENGKTCEPTSSEEEPPCLETGYIETEGCKGNEMIDIYTYHYDRTYTSSYTSTRSGGKGVLCVSNKVDGDLGLKGSGFSNAYNGSDGADYDILYGEAPTCFNSEKSGGRGNAPCVNSEGRGVELPECSDEYPPSSSSYTITKADDSDVSAIAISASAGGAGAIRKLCTDDDGHSDRVVLYNLTQRAINGYCDDGTEATSTCGSGWYGYCLTHHDGITEANGSYRWKFSYNNNYLTYGAAGEPGELKTAIVRSLKNVDTTIRLGVGGAPGEEGTGENGAKGTATTFGSIIKADGGKGGEGKLQSPISTFLPAFDAEKYANNELRITYTGQKGKQAIATGLASKIMNLIVDNNDGSDPTNIFMQKGIGGQGGGVQHNCWAGQRVYYFEGILMPTYSVFRTEQEALNNGGTKFVDPNCSSDYAPISAEKGNPGALLIKW